MTTLVSRRVRMRRVLVLVLLLGLPLLVAVSASAVAQEAASPTYAAWRDLFMTVLWVAIVVSIIVYGALIYALIRFRARKGGPKEGPHIHGNTRLEIMWSIAPAVVMGWLLFISFDGLFMVDDHPDDDIDFWVDVTASQFRFDFSFPDGSESINGSFAVEENAVVGLRLTSTDVIHAFSVHDLAVMIDVMPNTTTETWFQATLPGDYGIRCRELCGVGHSYMGRGTFVSVFPDDHDGIPEYGYPPAMPAGGTGTEGGNGTTPPAQENETIPQDATSIDVTIGPGFTFTTKEIKGIEPGKPVVFRVKNLDAVTHDFSIGPNYDAGAADHGVKNQTRRLSKDATQNLVVTFDADATLEFWCDQPGHYSAMNGQLVVGTGAGGLSKKEPLLPGFDVLFLLGGLVVAGAFLKRR